MVGKDLSEKEGVNNQHGELITIINMDGHTEINSQDFKK